MIHLSETDIPLDWTYDSIENGCIKVTSGGTPSRKNKDFYINGVIPWVKTKELKDGYIQQTEESITHDAIKNSSAKILPSGTILLAMYGATVGMLGITQGEMTCNQACCALITDSETLDKDFLFYFLLSNRKNLINLATGAAQQNISGALVKDIAVPRPDLQEQRKIGTVLRTLDDKIELNQKMNQTLEDIAKAIFKSWFVDFDPVRAKAEGRPTGLPPEISDLFPDELVDSEIGEIPKGWRTSPLLSLCKKIESGGTPSRKTAEYWDAGTIPWFKTGEFCDSPLLKSEEHITPLGLNKSAAKEWAPQTILFAMYGATVGKMAYLTETGTANQAVAGIVPDENFGFAFVWQTLISGRSRLMSLANGAAQQNLNLGLVKDFTVITPSSELARTFSNATNSIYQRITLLNKESDCLSELRDTLLPKLISGELRIPDAEKFLEEAGI
jgi:type I restriction enzyme S subunit